MLISTSGLARSHIRLAFIGISVALAVMACGSPAVDAAPTAPPSSPSSNATAPDGPLVPQLAGEVSDASPQPWPFRPDWGTSTRDRRVFVGLHQRGGFIACGVELAGYAVGVRPRISTFCSRVMVASKLVELWRGGGRCERRAVAVRQDRAAGYRTTPHRWDAGTRRTRMRSRRC